MTDREKLIDIIFHTPCVVVSSSTAAEHIIDNLIANGVTFVTDKNDGSKWIPASELPETDDEVLVWFEYFRYGSYNRMFRTIGIGHTFRGEWSGFVNGESGWQKLKILAWMPLPEPPMDMPSITENTMNALKRMGEKVHRED